MSLFRLVAKLGIDSTEFTSGMKKVESGMSASMSAIGSRVAAAFSVAAVTAFARTVANAAGEIGDLAEQLQITTAEVQALQRAADHSGMSFDKYAAALGKIRKLKADFAAGDKTAAATFSKTGLNPKSSDLSILQQLGGLPDAQAFEILDAKSARLKSSLTDLRALTPVELIDEHTIKRLDDAGDSLGDIWRIIKAMGAKTIVTTMDAGVGLGVTIDEALSSLFGIRSAMDQRNNGRALPLHRSAGGASPHQEFRTETGMPDGYTKNGRSAEWVGPMQAAARGRFSAIPTGDRSNIGGFFGPNVDINRKMSADIAAMRTRIESIEKVVTGAVVES